MKSQRSVVFALIIVACVTIFVFWRPNVATVSTAPVGSPAASPMASPSPSLLATATPHGSPARVSTPVPFKYAISAANQNIIRECLKKSPDLPTVHYTEDMRLTELMHDLQNGAAAAPENLTMNIHVSRPDGSSQRLHLEPHDSETKASDSRWPVGHSDVRVFDVDAEGLPIVIPVPPALKLESMKSIVDGFSSQGKVTFSERRFHEKFAQHLSVDVVETDNHISELQLFFNGNSLGCAWSQVDRLKQTPQDSALTCKCL